MSSTSASNNKNLPDVLREMSSRSKRRRLNRSVDDDAENDATNDTIERQERKDRFAKLASTVLYLNTSSSSTSLESQDVKKKLLQQDVERYQQLLNENQKEIEHIDNVRKRVYQEQVDLWGVYKFGLEKIMKLQDLSEAPDAILPGNFCT